VEWPTYELIVTTLEYLGVTVRYFDRRMEDGFRVDPEEVERKITPHTRLIVLTNLHNPTGALTDEVTLRAVGDVAKKSGARVLVDEVYLEALYERRPRRRYTWANHFLVTSSLTKAYGLSGLRCGWVLAEPGTHAAYVAHHDLYGVNAAHPAELMSVIALDNLERVAARAKKLGGESSGAGSVFCDRATTLSTLGGFRHGRFSQRIGAEPSSSWSNVAGKYETSVCPGQSTLDAREFSSWNAEGSEMTRVGFRRLTALDKMRDVKHQSDFL